MDKELKALYIYMLKHKGIPISQYIQFCEINNKSGYFVHSKKPNEVFNLGNACFFLIAKDKSK